MGIRDQIAANVAPVLEDGETVQAVFSAQTASPYLALITYWLIVIGNAYRVVVVTDRRILVCHSGRFRTSQVKDVMRELPRSTVIGPATGMWYKTDALGETLYVHKRFHKDIARADAAVATV
jgi:hypothetical protein